jgi:hypothetical protein
MSNIADTDKLTNDAAVPHRRVTRTPELIPLDLVRGRLALIWLIGSGVSVILVVLQSLLGRFGDQVQDVWGWLLPTIMPTLTMIITALGYTALDPLRSKAAMRRDFFRLARSLSLVYLGLVAMTVLIGPVAAGDGPGMIKLMHTSNLWLGPFQGLVASAIGVLFVTKQKQSTDRS